MAIKKIIIPNMNDHPLELEAAWELPEFTTFVNEFELLKGETEFNAVTVEFPKLFRAL
jgi:hypothetical protein